MPWHGDQFEYTRGYVRLLLETFLEKQEEIRRVCRDPSRNSAMPYYDMLRAIDGITFTQKQWEAFYLRLCGYTYREIGFLFGIRHQSVTDRVKGAEDKILGFLREDTCQTPPLRG